MKKTLLSLAFVTCSCFLFSQEIISSAGKSQVNSDYEVSWTVGEPVINTFSSENYKLTQGFHQSKLVITALEEIDDLENLVKVFPNPTNNFAVVKLNQIPDNLSYKLMDLSGKSLKSEIINSIETHVNLTNYTKGTYLLKILNKNGQPLQTFKIIKQ